MSGSDQKLETRDGLPEHLRVLADLYPRAEWRGHPNFSDLTAFWLDRHVMFRQLANRLVEGAQIYIDNPHRRYGPELSRYAGFLLNQLHGHHMIEDTHYFPQFHGLDARLEKAFDLLDGDHHALDGHIHALAGGTNEVLALLQQDGAATRKAVGGLLERQEAFRSFLERHLQDEEEVIVPLILEYGPDIS